MAAGDLPPHVATNELIQSAWGNAVVDELLRDRNEVFQQFDHAGLSTGANGLYDLGTTSLGPFAFPVRITVWATFTFGFGSVATNWTLDIYRFVDNATRPSPAPIQANIPASWYTTTITWTWAVPTAGNAVFKTRANLTGMASGQAWAGSFGIYHVQRTGTP